MRKVTYVKLHTTIFVPRGGSYSSTLEIANNPSMTMFDEPLEGGVIVTNKGFTFKVPYGNIINMVYAPEEKKSAAVNEKNNKPSAA